MKHINKTNIFIFLVFLLQPLASFLLSYFVKTYNLNLSFAEQLLFTQGLLIFVPALIFFAVSGKDNPCKRLKFRALSIKQVILLFVVAFCTIPISGLIRLITSTFVSAPITETLEATTTAYPYLLTMLLIAVIPAINEELFVRGILFSNYKKINTRTAILISSMLFGMLHFNFDQFFYATILGVILALVYEFTENLIAPMIVHFVINGTSVTLLYLSKGMTEIIDNSATPDLSATSEALTPIITSVMFTIIIGLFALFTVFSILILYIIIKYFAKLTNKLDDFYSLTKGKPKFSLRSLAIHWPLCLCVIIFVTFSLLIEFS